MKITADPVINNILTLDFFDKEDRPFYEFSDQCHGVVKQEERLNLFYREPNRVLISRDIKVDYFKVKRRWTYIGNKHCISINRIPLKVARKGTEFKTTHLQIPPRFPAFFRIMADFGDAYLWNLEGSSTAFYNYCPDAPALNNLDDLFYDVWCKKFHKITLFQDQDPLRDLKQHWVEFHEEAFELSIQAKNILGDKVELIYTKPFEDDCTDYPKVHIIA
ncbi:hypothetical protein [Sneathiella sp.]|jgi:hypothetical protein|uniref:hypothetical protein n=1 Tax=Sneathiella sp. TaxID=1964365 RepID=UPI0039E682CD